MFVFVLVIVTVTVTVTVVDIVFVIFKTFLNVPKVLRSHPKNIIFLHIIICFHLRTTGIEHVTGNDFHCSRWTSCEEVVESLPISIVATVSCHLHRADGVFFLVCQRLTDLRPQPEGRRMSERIIQCCVGEPPESCWCIALESSVLLETKLLVQMNN